MDIVRTSLEALIQRATNNQNQCPDTAAIDAVCGLVNREPDSTQTAVRLIISKVHSMQEWEALQALHVLDACMKRCGGNFHAEVGKFRFLNELIKLVSPKYLGAQTPEPVRRRVLELMQSWTIDYPRETKIKEAYEMLKKQGVVKEEKVVNVEMQKPPEVVAPRQQNSIFQDEEKSRLLKKLLQSKNPDDLQTANRLIKTMVKEDERRLEQKVRHVTELEAVHNNARLLSEMLDSYRPGSSSNQDLELITELHTSCQRLRPSVFKLASEVHTDESLFNEVLAANDELGDVFDKYTRVIVQGKIITSETGGGSSLLDLSTPNEEFKPSPLNTLDNQLAELGLDFASSGNVPTQSKIQPENRNLPSETVEEAKPDLVALGEIFSTPSPGPRFTPLQPISAHTTSVPITKSALPSSTLEQSVPDDRSNKLKALDDLDMLGAALLKESLPASKIASSQFKSANKVPMNQLNRLSDVLSPSSSPSHKLPGLPKEKPTTNDESDKDLDLLIGSLNERQQPNTRVNGDNSISELIDTSPISSTLDHEVQSQAGVVPLVDTSKKPERDATPVKSDKKEGPTVKPLGDISVSLESIKPGTLPPRTLVDERNGISVMLHISKSRPREDVSVFVVTATSKNTSSLSDYLFQSVVPRTCRLKLQPPTSTELPPHNPFLPPSVISQVMLIASATKDPITLKFIVSYTMDEETITEMGEIIDLPLTGS